MRRAGSLLDLIERGAADRDQRAAARALDQQRRALAADEERLTGRPPVDRRGGFGTAAGRVAVRLNLPPLTTTSAQLCSVYPFVVGEELPVDGPYVGLDVYSRTPFCFSLHELYRAKAITAPNMTVTGRIGTAKSSLLKTLAFRGVPFGVKFYCVDIRSEYAELARLCGITPVRIGPGLGTTINPLAAIRRDPGMPEPQWLQLQRARRLLLLEGLLEIQVGERLTEAERSLIEYAVDAVTRTDDGTSVDRHATPTLSHVLHAMSRPDGWRHRLEAVDYPLEAFTADSRRVRLALERLIRGALGGVFDSDDTDTQARIDFTAAGAVLDLQAIRSSDQLTAMAMTCAQSWLEAELSRPAAGPRICIYDEFTLVARHLGLVRRMREQTKLARALGIGNILAFHRFSDLSAVGEAGSEQVRIARGLIEDSGVRVSYGQEPGSLEQAAEFLGTNDTETDLLRHLRQGVGLWRIGNRSIVVRHQLSTVERRMVHTDSQMEALPDTAGDDAPDGTAGEGEHPDGPDRDRRDGAAAAAAGSVGVRTADRQVQ
ncbi:hypothetical protein ACQEVZ_55680 [Dactylosporangium sp. CA-152071]|uniref:hypothetical protein n=1 Tax=Dactylosporangium sp. CA-152071 TaxID=3239933 RepID=UPI003D9112E1